MNDETQRIAGCTPEIITMDVDNYPVLNCQSCKRAACDDWFKYNIAYSLQKRQYKYSNNNS